MKNTRALLILLVLFMVVGCTQQKVNQEQAQQHIAEAVQQAPEISIDKDMPGAAISLTRNFYFILDASGSMYERLPGGGDHEFRTKLEGAKWAIGEFVKNVPTESNLGLYVFGAGGAREMVPLCTDRQQFLNAVQSVESDGGTPLAEAIKIGTDKLVKQFKKQLGYGEYRLIVVTDGEANGLEDAALYAARFNVPIYSIGYGMASDHPLRQYSVSYRTANSTQDLAKGLEETLGETPNFDPTEFSGNGK